ncbi:shikimate kinase [Clostridium sp. SHJSY1]|uniref:shikimate kinase n=1 Tax=Clostridium sp. SHJSY1 TaxID=2942483 RepID=UPI002875482A|nr:shikimate kinase [Clostridium sp. SHJSY1]MDS0525535.1 shikimate kinase [Clostridium sp. SHJSY1]
MVSKKNNIVLIGMPGCGKSTLGKSLAEEFKFKFYDMDEYIQKISKKTIPELFEESESIFRKWEWKACEELSKKDKAVISSGGGVVKIKRNIDILKKDCIILFIDRAVEDIIKDVDINKRPLLKDGANKLYELHNERYTLYNEAADIMVENVGNLDEVLNKCKEKIAKSLGIKL